MTATYGPGPGYGLVTPDGVVVLGAAADADLVSRVWAALAEPDPGVRVLRELVSAAGGDFAALCPFALVVPSGAGTRVVVRGPLTVTVRSAAGDERIDGTHVVTWAEREVPDAHEVAIAEGDPTDDGLLPIGLGVVRSGTVVLALGPAPAAASGRVVPAAAPAAVTQEAVPRPDRELDREPDREPDPVPSAGAPLQEEPAPDGFASPLPPEPGGERDRTPGQPEAVGEGTTWGPGVTLVDYVPLAPPAPPAPMAEPEQTYDDLFGPTRIHAVEEAAVRPVDELPPPPPPPDEDDDPDHDHRTVVGVRRHRSGTPPPPEATTPPGPTVLGRHCAAGHDNPPTRSACRVCGGPVAGPLTQVTRPPLGRMRFATGAVVDLDAPVVLGRRPRVARVTGEQLPRVVTLPSPLGEISGSHLAVRLEEWLVLGVDLDSSNGTVLLRPGASPRRLAPQQPEILRSGDVLDLGDGAVITFEDLP